MLRQARQRLIGAELADQLMHPPGVFPFIGRGPPAAHFAARVVAPASVVERVREFVTNRRAERAVVIASSASKSNSGGWSTPPAAQSR